MKSSLKHLAAAVAGALVVVAAPIQAGAQPLQQPSRCLRSYQDKVFMTSMGPVVVYTPPETVTLYPGNAVAPVMYVADATLDYVNCVLSGT